MFVKLEPNKDVIKILSWIIKNFNNESVDCKRSKEDFIQQSVPNINVETDEESNILTRREILNLTDKKLLACTKLLNAKECTNAIMYYPNSLMKWHTNSDNPGTRIYYSYTLGEACFRYIDKDNNDLIDYDNIGWTVRKFIIPEDGLFWHTIWTNKTRYSFGFNQ